MPEKSVHPQPQDLAALNTTMHHQRQHTRHLRISVAPPIASSRLYPSFPASPFPSTPSSASTPSKRRHSSAASATSSVSSLFLLLFSLRSLYSLLPFIRSTPSSFSLFPFSFLVSLLSFSLLSLSILPSDPHLSSLKSLTLTLASSPSSHLRPLAAKSALLTLVFLLRFQALRYCSASATILADLSGALVAKTISEFHHRRSSLRRAGAHRICGIAALIVALSLLSYSWDRTGCFPLSSSPPPDEGCVRLLPMLPPFLSGFLGFYERASSNWSSLRQLGRKRVLVASLALTTAMLFIPASISFFMADEGAVTIGDLGWPLINTVIFGVVLSENYSDEKVVFSAKDFRRDFLVTFFCTLLLELVYFPKLSLPGFLFCGFLLWISVRELGSSSLSYLELGSSDPSESLRSMIMNPICHILSERKSRKIALFLLINTAYMVVEFVAGFMSNSLGLISDACHMLFDCAALAIGLYASYISRLPANNQFNYGRGRFEVLSGYVNAVFLVLVGVLIVLESFERILDPQEISTNSLLTVSIGGLVVNVVGLVFFHVEHHHAHGGGSTCSHSHHDHHLEHHDHHHDHHHEHPDHHHGHDGVGHAQEPTDEDHRYVAVSRESSNGHSQGDHNHHSGNHDDCHHHEHHHHHHGLDGVGHAQEPTSERHRSVSVSCESSTGHSHGGHNHHSFNHDDCHHDQKVENRIHTDHGRVIDHLDDHHCHGHEQGHRGHPDHAGVHIHRDSTEGKHEHHGIDSSSLPKEPTGKGSTPKDSQKHRHIDHNMEGIFLHVLADTMGSVGVVISTLLIKYRGWLVADPVCSIFMSVMIVSSVIPLLRNSAEILLQRVPRAHERDLKVAFDDLMRINGVCGVQNVHVWNFTNMEIVGTLHLHVSPETDKAFIKKSASELLHEAGIKDVTIQVECVKG